MIKNTNHNPEYLNDFVLVEQSYCKREKGWCKKEGLKIIHNMV